MSGVSFASSSGSENFLDTPRPGSRVPFARPRARTEATARRTHQLNQFKGTPLNWHPPCFSLSRGPPPQFHFILPPITADNALRTPDDDTNYNGQPRRQAIRNGGGSNRTHLKTISPARSVSHPGLGRKPKGQSHYSPTTRHWTQPNHH